MKLKNVEKFVLQALEENERARDNSFILYGAVLKRMGFDLKMPLNEFLAIASREAPTFESVSRCRRHLVEIRPELAGNKKARQDKVCDYVEYNHTHIGDFEEKLKIYKNEHKSF